MNKLEEKFAKIGARIKIREPRNGNPLLVDVLRDADGEYFDIRIGSQVVGLNVLNVDKLDRHLLLMVRTIDGEQYNTQKLLCGYDERHFFVAGVNSGAANVAAAKESLKPREVRDAECKAGVTCSKRNKRKNVSRKRVGEWFFLPVPDLKPDEKLILKKEPIRRGGGKPHWCEFLYRVGGETVYVCSTYPNGVNAATYNKILKEKPEAKVYGWRVMAKDANVYVCGRISHADHKTINLSGWHRVVLNTEGRSKAMRHVAFLD